MNGVTTAQIKTATPTRATFRFLIRRAWQVMNPPLKRLSASCHRVGGCLQDLVNR